MTFTLQLNVLHWRNHKHAEPEILCPDMFWIHFIFNDRLTLIPRISGLSTQWQVHMVLLWNSSKSHIALTCIQTFLVFFCARLLIWSRARCQEAAVMLLWTSPASSGAESHVVLTQPLCEWVHVILFIRQRCWDCRAVTVLEGPTPVGQPQAADTAEELPVKGCWEDWDLHVSPLFPLDRF